MVLSSAARQMIRQIRSKYKDPVTKKPSFATDDEVIDYAIKTIYELLDNQSK